MAERTVVLRYTAPVYVTVDLDAEKVAKVECADTEVEPSESDGKRPYAVDFWGFEAFTDDELAAAVKVADEDIWPAWQWIR